ncbi:MAG: lytic murein transglycosylase [Candidatus Zambryskibacteria bacterium]|nr:lytic murein transglycosylase [Candidatus Zambryskibacteria bacterium]
MNTYKTVLKFLVLTPFALVLAFGAFSLASAQSACTSNTAGKTRAQLEQELEACNREIAQWTTTLNQTKQESASFQRDVAALTAKINAAQANIKGKNIAIANISKDIATKQSQINVLDSRITLGKKAIADILRKTNDINSYSLVEAILSDKDLSEFFVDLDTYASTKKSLQNLFAELRTTKALTESEKAVLARKKEAEAAAKVAIELAKKEVEVANTQKKSLLADSQNKEKTYAQVLAEKQATAAKIRAVLFPLAASGPIPFGTALQYAKAAETQTGVRAAFILGIFATESGKASDGTFGKILGNCLLTNSPNKGDGKGKNTGTPFSKVMRADHVRDDAAAFMEIAKSLGFDPYSQPVSCPQSFGYGGAMGPAQFIPTTWKLMVPRLTNALGRTPNPWSPQDAFMAASFYLSDLGASSGTYEAERKAAHRYNGVGAPCGTSQYHYCNAVMIRAADIQRDIDFLNSI